MVWWLIPITATLVAYVCLRFAGTRDRSRRAPEPGSPQDRAELERLARALRQPMPGRSIPGRTDGGGRP